TKNAQGKHCGQARLLFESNHFVSPKVDFSAPKIANHASEEGHLMQQNGAAPVLIFRLHGTNKNYVLSLTFDVMALTFFHLLQLIG
ncbi:MAG: hypothetical protein ABIQ90_02595, partial [Polaromonas sp.]